ncbi:MAG: SIS domain-containing protein [Verrucomicrobia bacterium]|nr:SIS domain-containing protein [Verrucomicrobiota bacterium]
MKEWLEAYLEAFRRTVDAVPAEQVAALVRLLKDALDREAQVFVFGNGGSAANASHFAVDLGKGASDKLPRRFKVLSLADNVSWLTALANDYAYEEVFVGQLQNYARPGDVAIALSVSGNSPNCVKAVEWARERGLKTVALVGARGGRLAEAAELVIRTADGHYGRAEDAHMLILHLVCYAFMEGAAGG